MSQSKQSKALEFLKKIERLSTENPSFKPEAFSFIMASLNFTVARLKKHRHVSGRELAEGAKDYALREFGPLAQTVLEYWGISATQDIGRIVFSLIDAGLLHKNEEDRLEDFYDVYNFDVALKDEYWKELRKNVKFRPLLTPTNKKKPSQAKGNG